MADQNQGGELPQRIPGVGWTGPRSRVVPALSPEMRQHIHAAVTAERARQRAGVALADRDPGPDPGAGPEGGIPGWFDVPVRPRRAAESESITPPVSGPEPRRTALEPEPVGPPVSAAEPGRKSRPRPGRRRWTLAALAALGLALVIAVSLAVVVRPFSRPAAAQPAVRAQAAAWIAGQVSPDSTVSCDAAMCAALRAHGFPAGKLIVLGPASADPMPSDLVIETSAVHALFGNSLAKAWAPTVLASFGSGASLITVRVVAPHGAAAYQTSLQADRAARQRSGTALLSDAGITVSATARSQLAAGQVDSRLLVALASLAARQPVDIVQFENSGPGASPGVPLRFADLADSVPSTHIGVAAYVRTTVAVLSAAAARIGPASVITGTLQGRSALQVQFTAPSPLEVPGASS
jgi:hypothetical protein